MMDDRLLKKYRDETWRKIREDFSVKYGSRVGIAQIHMITVDKPLSERWDENALLDVTKRWKKIGVPQIYIDKLLASIEKVEEGAKKRYEDYINNPKHILKRPDLFELITVQEMDKKIVGEIANRQTIFLVACGAFVENSNPASFNLCVNSESGAGKDYVVKNVLSIFPKPMVESRTRISPTAFTYWHNSKFEPEWTWDGKICYLQDISNSVLNSDVFKVMCSEGSHATVVKDQRAIDIEIKGKPVMIITTASANPNAEILRRFPIIMLDESKDQTKAIMKRKAEYAKLGMSMEYNPKITEALGHLKRVRVKVPFADMLVDVYPADHIIMRTHFERLIDYIKASATLHQYQRKRDEGGFVIAEPQDYDIALIALRQTTTNIFMIPLTRKQEKLLELCKEEFGYEWFTASDVKARCNFISDSKIYDYLNKLQEHFFDVDKQEVEGSKKPVKVFRLKQVHGLTLPSWDDICRKMEIKGIDNNEGIVGVKGIDSNNHNNKKISASVEPKRESGNCSGINKSIAGEENERTIPTIPAHFQVLNITKEKVTEFIEKNGEVTYGELIEHFKLKDNSEGMEKLDKVLENLRGKGVIFEPRAGILKLVYTTTSIHL